MSDRLRLRLAIIKWRFRTSDFWWGFRNPGAAVRSNLPIR